MLKELGGNGECLLKSICYAIYGSVDCQDYLRLAIMKELSNNKEYYQPYCLLDNSTKIFPIPEYVVIHSKKDAYYGGLEILACCKLQPTEGTNQSLHPSLPKWIPRFQLEQRVGSPGKSRFNRNRPHSRRKQSTV